MSEETGNQNSRFEIVKVQILIPTIDTPILQLTVSTSLIA